MFITNSFNRPSDSKIISASTKATSIRHLARLCGYSDHPGSNTVSRFVRVLGKRSYNRLASGRSLSSQNS